MKNKIWILYLISLIIGIVLGIFLPAGVVGEKAFSFLANIGIRTLRLTFFPFVFCSLTVAVCQIRREKKFTGSLFRNISFLSLMTAGLVILGVVTTLIIGPERIKRSYQKPPDVIFLSFPEILNSILPDNFFKLFVSDGVLILPLVLLAILLGYHLHYDREIAEPTYNLMDSLSRIFYRINKYIIYLEVVFIIPMTVVFIHSMKKLENPEYYTRLILVLISISVLVIFGVFPLLLIIFSKGRKKPYKTLFAFMTPIIAAFSSGDMFFTTIYSMQSSKENLGIPRKVGAFNLSLYSLFSRGGTALISASCMLFILKSHSDLELTFFQIFWVTAFSFLISFLSFQTPTLGFYFTISIMCGFYGRGLEKGFETLIPVLPFLNRLAVLLDSTEAQTANILLAKREKQTEEIPASKFI